MKLTNKGYDALKFVALVLLPALSAAYIGLAQFWNLPKVEEVVGTATVLDTFLGLLLRSSSTKYGPPKPPVETIDGALVVTTDPDDGEKYFALQIEPKSFAEILNKETVKLVVAEMRPAPPKESESK